MMAWNPPAEKFLTNNHDSAQICATVPRLLRIIVTMMEAAFP
jgi:hypothetical protein